MIHFDKNLIRYAERLHDVKEYMDVFNVLAKIEQTLNSFDIEKAQSLDNELIKKYPTIKIMLTVANNLPKINGNKNVSSFTTQATVFDNLVQDKFGIYTHILLKSNYIKNIEDFIAYVD